MDREFDARAYDQGYRDGRNEAAGEIERLRSGGCARDQGTTQYCAEAAALAAENAKLRAALEEIDNELNTAAQDDCENGVKWLNERAAEGYLKEYPCTLAAISEVLRITRAALGGEND